jgi:carboxylate-amine ligase
MRAEPSFTIGVEEEYHLVRTSSGDLVTQQADELLAQCQARFGERVTREFQQCQLEIATEVCRDMQEVRADLLAKRAGINAVAQQFGIGPIAASTHPYGQWHQQIHTPKPRYDMLAEDMQIAARRLLICGMHVHVGIEPEELRIDLLNQAAYFLPHLLALSTSSPFWQGELTGLKAYRLSVFDEVPRTGVPEQFSNGVDRQQINSDTPKR